MFDGWDGAAVAVQGAITGKRALRILRTLLPSLSMPPPSAAVLAPRVLSVMLIRPVSTVTMAPPSYC